MVDKLLIIGIVAAAGVLVYYVYTSRKEHYGSMKNIKQIPFNDCRRICEGYRNKCVVDFKDADPTWCDRSLDACTNECYYTAYHQLPG